MLLHLEAIEQSQTFSLDQAQRSLVLVSRIVSDIVDHFGRLLQLQAAMEKAHKEADSQTFQACREDIRRIFGCLQACRSEIEQMGAKLKDWGKGIVHFPLSYQGRTVQLCWKHGEENISCWHEIGACGSDRRPLGTLTGLGEYIPREQPAKVSPKA